MSATRGRRRRFGAATATTVWFASVAAVAVMVGALGLASVPAGALTLACGGNGNVAMVGTPTQTMIQQNLYIPQHVAACPFAQGTLSYRGSSDDAAVLAATLRTNPLMAIDVPLTVVEKGVLETDATALQGRAAGLVNQIPALLDGFSVGYNLAGCNVTQPVNLRGAVLAAIFSGAVTNWSDPTIVVDNPDLANCRLRIQVAVRND